jgi:WS/DGAT/MGAT family acyltransferase
MAYTHYDRLTALDASFLELETDSVHMHVGSVGIFEHGPLASDDGGIDFDRLREHFEAGLRRVARFRQKLSRVPVSGHPVWVDDEHFNLLYHLRHTSLPLPGDERQLKRLVGRIMSEKLDRAKPLWELWCVEGLQDGHFAVVSKVHHSVIDGISGVDMLAAFMGTDAEYEIRRADHRWLPRPSPRPLGLLSDEVARRASLPLRAARAALRSLPRGARVGEIAHSTTGFAEALGESLHPASETPFNVEIGPHRRFDWTRFPLEAVRGLKASLGGTINDVVLACVAGAVRRYLEAHGSGVDDIDFRAFVPVSTRSPEERGKLGNRVSMVIVPLPVDEPDPRRRMTRVTHETRRVKRSGAAEGAELLEEIGDWTTTSLLTQMSRLTSERRAFNLVVTNVPGPPVPIHLCGSRMLASYPLVPLFTNQALGIAVFSYDGGLYWGFNADWDALPDVHAFVEMLDAEFETLRKL